MIVVTKYAAADIPNGRSRSWSPKPPVLAGWSRRPPRHLPLSCLVDDTDQRLPVGDSHPLWRMFWYRLYHRILCHKVAGTFRPFYDRRASTAWAANIPALI